MPVLRLVTNWALGFKEGGKINPVRLSKTQDYSNALHSL